MKKYTSFLWPFIFIGLVLFLTFIEFSDGIDKFLESLIDRFSISTVIGFSLVLTSVFACISIKEIKEGKGGSLDDWYHALLFIGLSIVSLIFLVL